MHTLRRGFLAGVLASLVLALFDFVTDGAPGNGFPAVLRWFGLTMTDPTISHWAGFLLLIVLGGVVGLIFGGSARQAYHHRSRAPDRAGARRALVAPL